MSVMEGIERHPLRPPINPRPHISARAFRSSPPCAPAVRNISTAFPPELVDMFAPVMRDEGRHILFFVNRVAWHHCTMPWWRRPVFEAKVMLVWAFLIGERISMAHGMGDGTQARENNFTLDGSKALGVEVTFPELARICLAENDRRLAPYHARLIRPRVVPGMIRLALRLAGRARPRPA